MKKTNLLKAAVSLLLSATVLFTGCTALTDGVAGGETEAGGERSINGRKSFIYTRSLSSSALENPNDFDYIYLFNLKLQKRSSDKGIKEYTYNQYYLDVDSFNNKFGSKISSFSSKSKLILTFGSDGAQKYYIQQVLSNSSRREQLVKDLKKLVNSTYKIGGLDIDWEFNGSGSWTDDDGNKQYFSDAGNSYNSEKLATFISELKSGSNKISRVTLCCRNDETVISKMNEKGCFDNVDYLNLMGYEGNVDTAGKNAERLRGWTWSSKVNFGIGLYHSDKNRAITFADWVKSKWNDGASYGVVFFAADKDKNTYQGKDKDGWHSAKKGQLALIKYLKGDYYKLK